MPFLAHWAVATPSGDIHATLDALADGSARPGRLVGPLLPLLQRLGGEVCIGKAPDVVLLATAKGDLPLWAEAVLPGGDRHSGSPACLARQLARHFACPAWALGAACASGPVALAEAARLIRAGDARRVLVLGGDRLADFVDEGFAGLKAVDPDRCRPFDAARAGIQFGETAAAVLLDAATGRVQLQGWGQSLDASHLTAPTRDGGGLSAACSQALALGLVALPGLIVAHGTGTRANDDAESLAYARIMGGVPVVGWKGGLGHSLGACGLTEVVLAAECLATGAAAPGTVGYHNLGVPGAIRVLGAGLHVAPGPWLSTNAGFGGMNGVVLLGDRPPRALAAQPAALVTRAEATAKGWEAGGATGSWGIPAAVGILPRPTARQVTGAVDPSWGRMDAPCRLLVALGHLLKPWPSATHIVLLTDSGCLLTDAAFERGRREGVPDFQSFAYTLASTPIGEASIRLGIRGGGQVVLGASDREGRRMAERCIGEGAPAVLLARIETGVEPEVAWIERYERAPAPCP